MVEIHRVLGGLPLRSQAAYTANTLLNCHLILVAAPG